MTTELSATSSGFWVLGGGKMGEAFLKGALEYFSQDQEKSRNVWVIEPMDSLRDRIASVHDVSVFPSVAAAIKTGLLPETVFLAVKPDHFLALSEELKALSGNVLAISVMAGLPLSSLEGALPALRWVRTMSNLALTTGEGMTVVAPGSRSTSSDSALVLDLFSRMGRALILPEKDFDVATAISGSGPGLLALVADALVDSGVLHGLKKETASFLVAQMILGTGSLLSSGISAGELKGQVASPGGTTIEGLAALETKAVRGAFIEAIVATVKKSRLLGEASLPHGGQKRTDQCVQKE